jgi:hypothetical protein
VKKKCRRIDNRLDTLGKPAENFGGPSGKRNCENNQRDNAERMRRTETAMLEDSEACQTGQHGCYNVGFSNRESSR